MTVDLVAFRAIQIALVAILTFTSAPAASQDARIPAAPACRDCAVIVAAAVTTEASTPDLCVAEPLSPIQLKVMAETKKGLRHVSVRLVEPVVPTRQAWCVPLFSADRQVHFLSIVHVQPAGGEADRTRLVDPMGPDIQCCEISIRSTQAAATFSIDGVVGNFPADGRPRYFSEKLLGKIVVNLTSRKIRLNACQRILRPKGIDYQC